MSSGNPLIVQSDHTALLEVGSPLAEACRAGLARFAELEKSPEHIHTYRITPLSLWNAASAGIAAADILGTLERYSKFDLPRNVLTDIEDYISRFGRVNQNGFPTVFSVVGLRRTHACAADWYRVRLPVRPNGTRCTRC